MNLIEQLNWRYATKKYNGQSVSPEKLNYILEAIRLSASSIGLQPYTVLVIENEELRKQILPIAFDQPQIVESSHLLVFAAWDNVTAERAEEYLDNIAETRNVNRDTLGILETYVYNLVNNNTAEQNLNWAARQAYIALGTALVAAAEQQVDATPMEGFNPAALDELLNLKFKNLKSVALLPIGYRDAENDWNANLPKVRREKEKLFLELDVAYASEDAQAI
jgi:nitroreductase